MTIGKETFRSGWTKVTRYWFSDGCGNVWVRSARIWAGLWLTYDRRWQLSGEAHVPDRADRSTWVPGYLHPLPRGSCHGEN